MSRVRFATVRALFETFPEVAQRISAAPTDQFPVEFLKGLASQGKLDEAVTFCSYLLPRREAVWWASQCVRSLIDTPSEDDEIALEAAEDWVREPEEPKRQAALRIGLSASRRDASTWVALAAAWSGGSLIVSESGGPPAPPHLTAKAARGALMLALVNKPRRLAQISQCVERGVQIAESP